MIMKYALLLFALIALANSKLPKLSFKSLLENIQSAYDDDIKLCEASRESKNQCTATNNLTTIYSQCCYISEKNIGESTCELFPKPLKDYKVVFDSKDFNPLFREIFGYSKYNYIPEEEEIPSDIDIKVECSDGNLEFALNGKFTEEEENILTSENHCLNYTVSSFINFGQKTEYNCKNGLLLPTSKNAGIECADLSLSFKGGAIEGKIQTCLPMAYDTYSKIKIPQYALDELKKAMSSFPFAPTQIIAELSDSKGRKISFDTETGEIISSNSIILSISKFLFLFSLFLF